MEHWSKSNDAFASALKEVDEIMKNNEMMLSTMDRDVPHYKSTASQQSRQISRMTTDSSGEMSSDQLAAAVLLSELRSEVSDVREVFRNLSSDKQLFLKSLVNETPNISNPGKSDGIDYNQALSDLEHELNNFCVSNRLPHSTSMNTSALSGTRTTWSTMPGGPAMGVGAIQLDRLVTLEEENKGYADQVAYLKAEIEIYQNKCKQLEHRTETDQEATIDWREKEYQNLVDENAQLKSRINNIELEKKELRQKIIQQRAEIEELNLRLVQQESDLQEAKLSTLQSNYNDDESNDEDTDSPVLLNNDVSTQNVSDSPPMSDIQSWQQTNSMEELRVCPGVVALVPPLTPPIKSRFMVSNCGRSNSLPASKVISAVSSPRKFDPGQVMDLSDFENWDADRLVFWLHRLGLKCYTKSLLKWVHKGKQLLSASKKQLEKGLGIRNSLHLKKILIYLRAAKVYPSTEALFMKIIPNSFSIQKWLDDIGLLPYLSLFQIAAIDANVLNQLTLEDLCSLKISNELHICSIRRGIQVLRYVNFDLDRFIRRPPLPNDTCSSDSSINENEKTVDDSVQQVMLWSHHRLMDWLRDIELPEYASNLRGSGLHGGLLILEDRVNAELFASVLNICADKTLLRRHLSLHFHKLVGDRVHTRKRDCEAMTDSAAMTVTSKIKIVRKRPNFFPRRRKNCLAEQEELLCPPESVCDIDCL